MIRFFILACGLTLLAAVSAQADTIYSEDFQDGNSNGWSLSGSGSGYVSLYSGNYSLHLSRTKEAVANLSTAGYSSVSVSMEVAASSLEGSESCIGEVSLDGGSSWLTVVEVINGQDDGVTLYSASLSPSGIDDNANVQLRFRAAGNQWNDYCWHDNAVVTGTPGITLAPDIVISGTSSFGDVSVQGTSDQVITIKNDGNADLTLGNLGTVNSPFSMPVDNCSNQVLVPAAQCTVTLRFSPTAVGTFSDNLSIVSDDPDQPNYSLTLNGNGVLASDNYDPLTGNGSVSRTELSYNHLFNGSDPGSLVNMSAFAVPANAAQPVNSFEGSLTLNGESTGGSFQEIRDDYNYTGAGDTTRKHLPEFSFEFVQTGTHIIPVQRGSIASAHPEWEYILEPGRVWQENSDNGYSRVAMPFSLQQKNANCIHNGVMTFLFQNNTTVSQVAYQISSETCLYFKANMWGLLSAQYNGYSVSDAALIKTAYQTEVADRLPTKPISDLAVDYGADSTQFGHTSETDPDHMSLFGFVIGGVNYVGGCETRHGTYPYCAVMDVPSYSTAKSSFAGVAMMRLEKKYPGVVSQQIASYIGDCASNGNWGDVTLEHTLDMATGNYGSSAYTVDEGAAHTSGLFLVESHANKINYSCTQYSRKVSPGSRWVYHTSDTYIAGTMMNAYVKNAEGANKDIFTTTLVEELWEPLNISPAAKVSRRTYDSVAQPFAGWGLTYHRDDIAKIAQFLNVDDGRINGQMMLDQDEFDSAMQRDAGDRGLAAGSSDYRYNNGFWAHDAKQILGCTNSTWVPFMSGYGGVTVLMMPNDTTYYYVSDNDTYLWARAAIESNNISSFCQ